MGSRSRTRAHSATAADRPFSNRLTRLLQLIPDHPGTRVHYALLAKSVAYDPRCSSDIE